MTRRCLHSVLASLQHTNDNSAEVAENISTNVTEQQIILVDNGSDNLKHNTTGTATQTPDYPVDSMQLCANIECLKLSPNQGFAKGMNAGLRHAFKDPQVNMVTTLSNDVELNLNFFKNLRAMWGDNDAPPSPDQLPSTCFPAAVKFPPLIFCPHVYFLSNPQQPAYTHGRVSADFLLSHHFDPGLFEIQYPQYYPAAALVWTRATFEKLSGFNEQFFCYWEDVELSFRCKQNDIKMISSDKLKIHHLGRGTTKGKKIYNDYFQQGRYFFKQIIENIPKT